ncbi:MAG: EAL domain-containing protein [Mycobacteriales bacterium]
MRAALQPIVRRDGVVLGHEALLRGCDPLRIFALARSQGWQLALDIRAAELALKAGAQFRRPGQALFVNVAPAPVDDLRAWFAAVQASPDARVADLVVEISEHQPEPFGPDLAAFCREVRSAGARVALDDVELGPRSLGLVRSIRPDVVKLSGRAAAFCVDDPLVRDQVAGLVEVADEALVVAECVEEQSEAETLAACGVTAFQGWLMGRPAVGELPSTDGWPGLVTELVLD